MNEYTVFSKKILFYIGEDRYGRSQAKLADEIGCRADTFNRYVLGKRRTPPAIVNKFAGLLDLNDKQRRELLELAGHEADLYVKSFGDHGTDEVLSIIQYIHEWKYVHSYSQKLLFSLDSLTKAFDLCLKIRDEYHANEIEDTWIRLCEPKARRIREKFVDFRYIRHENIDVLVSLLHVNEDRSLVWCVQTLNVKDDQSINTLRELIYDLVDILKELLIVADINIVQLSEKLMNLKKDDQGKVS